MSPPSVWPRAVALARRLVFLVSTLAIVLLLTEAVRWRPLPTGPRPTREFNVAAPYRDAGCSGLAMVESFLEENPSPGLSACVAVDRRPVWCLATGYSNLQSRAALTGEEPLRVGSLSKTITATILVRLAERGLIDLDKPIGGYVRDLPRHLQGVTPRQLATHTAGIRHYSWRLSWPPHETGSRRPYRSSAHAASAFWDSPLGFEPGTDFAYSSHGYTLLGAAMEGAAGRSFEELLDSELVQPAGLAGTVLDGQERAGGAQHYEVLAGWARPALRVDNSRSWAGGGLRSTAPDLVRFATSLAAGIIVSPQTRAMVLTEQVLLDGSPNPQGYGLGWRLTDTQEFLGGERSYRVAHHGGVAAGSSAFLALFAEQRLAVAVVTNSRLGSGPVATLAFDLAERFVPVASEATAVQTRRSRTPVTRD